MSEDLNSKTDQMGKLSPEHSLRFSVEALFAAGVQLGTVESKLPMAKTTFEELFRRAEEIDARIFELEHAPLCGLLPRVVKAIWQRIKRS